MKIYRTSRAFTILLAAALLFGIVGCGGANDNTGGGATTSVTTATTAAAATDAANSEQPSSEQNSQAETTAGTAETTASASGGAATGVKIIHAIVDDPEQMNPTLNTYSRSSNVLQQLFRGLYKFDDNNQIVPALAEHYSVDDTLTIYTFKLRPGLKWSDGSALTAHDFEFAWKLLLDPETASGAVSDMYIIKNARAYNENNATADDVGVKAVDDTTLVVTLENITPWFVAQTATTTYMPVSKAAVDKAANETDDGLNWAKSVDTFVSCGPFKLTAMNSKEKVSMVKNEYYYAADEVKIDAIDIMIIPDQETQAIAFENGELSLNNDPTPTLLQQYSSTPQFYPSPRIGMRYLDFNHENAQFSDVRVRQALAISINRQSIMDNIVRTGEKPLFGFTPYSQASLTDPSKDFREVCGDVFKEDSDTARQLLAEAGYPGGQGFPKFRLVCQALQLQKDIAQVLQSMWKTELGIDCEIVTYETGYWGEVGDGNFDVSFCGWTGDHPDPDTNLKLFAIGGNETESRWNMQQADGSYLDTQVHYNDIIEKTRKSSDPAEREALFIEAEHYLAEIMPSTPLYSYSDFFITQKNLHGVQKNYIGHINFEFAYFD